MKLKQIFRYEKRFVLIYVGFIISLAVYLFIYIAGSLMRAGFLDNIVPLVYLTEFIVLLPGPLLTDVIFLYLFPIASFLLFYIIKDKMIFIFVKIHKLTFIGRIAPEYGHVELSSNRSALLLIKRAFIVGFFSFSLSALFVQTRLALMFRALEPGMMDPVAALESGLFLSEAVFLGTFFFTSIAFFLFLPIWYLEDSGIILYRFSSEKFMTPMIKSTHYIYQNILTGLITISTIVALFWYLTQAFIEYSELPPGDPAILTPLILTVLPLLVTGIFAIPLIIYENTLPDMVKKLSPKLQEKGIPRLSLPTYNEMLDRLDLN